MNIERLTKDLNDLVAEWEKSRNKPDLIDRGEWVRGVVYGIKLAMRVLNSHDTAARMNGARY